MPSPFLSRWTFAVVFAGVALVALPDPAFATLQTSLEGGVGQAKKLFGWLRTIGILLGLFGFIGIAFSGYTGRFNFKWMLTIGGSMIVLGIAGVLVDFFVQTDGGPGTAPVGAATFAPSKIAGP